MKFYSTLIKGFKIIVLITLGLFINKCAEDKVLSPKPETGVHGYVVNKMFSKGIPNASIRFGHYIFQTDSSGYFQLNEEFLKADSSLTNLIIEHFPHKSKVESINNYSIDLPADTVYLELSNGMKRYAKILQEALDINYEITSVIDWFRSIEQLKNERIVIMRHDVDHDAITAKAMGYIEHQLGVKSTFYFRWLTAEMGPVDYLKNLGHEVGLHYETIATYCRVKNITEKEDVTPEIIDICRDLLKAEIYLFESIYGDIYSICSHGHELNRLLSIPNIVLMKDQNPKDFYVETWANSDELRKVPEIFVADSGNKWDPFSFGEAMERGFETIYVLIHPIWWSDN
ncbi:hypothetical protein H8E88_05875 [candidate division KSB1 bacterium]|nr:hypothetical protein [candidate division KSB1 bacterium]MBL7093537.1 hypothetical protein [candidate division KSB1 bacterium]